MDGLQVGRTVHHTGRDGETSATIVTKVLDDDDGLVNLTVFPDANVTAIKAREVPYSTTREADTWRWPPRD